MSVSNSIKNLDRDRLAARRETRQDGEPLGAAVRWARAKVTGGSASAGYSVILLTESGTLSGNTENCLGTFPGGQTIAAGTQVLLMYRGANTNPEIVSTGGTGATAPVIVSALGFVG